MMRLMHYNGSMISHSVVRAAIHWRDGTVKRAFRPVEFVYPIRFVYIQILWQESGSNFFACAYASITFSNQFGLSGVIIHNNNNSSKEAFVQLAVPEDQNASNKTTASQIST